MEQYQDFSSWNPEQERQFSVFEQRTVESSKKAWTISAIAGAAMFLLVLAVVMGFKPSHSSSEAAAGVDGPAGASLSAEPGAATAPAATAPAATAPAATAPTETAPAAATGTAPAAAAPTPPTGATKAPPTALVGGK